MKVYRQLRAVSALSLFVLASTAFAQPSLAAEPAHSMKTLLKVGPKATPSAAPKGSAGPEDYGLFTCQLVGGGDDPVNCYDPYEMRHAYQVDSLISAGYDGTGQTIVIVDAFQHPNIVAQMAVFDGFYGLPDVDLTIEAPDGVPTFDPNDDNMVGWAQETSLDVEWSHAIAPGARIVLVEAKSNNDDDMVSALKYAVDNDLGDVISMSFGENEGCLGPELQAEYHDVFAAATAKHITLFASSADEGAALQTCDGNSWVKAVSAPASDPLVTAVGGTELRAAQYCFEALGCDPTSNPDAGTWQSEIAWNEGYPYGDIWWLNQTIATGGGFSVVFGEPAYQQLVLPGGTQRAVPDVAYDAAVLHGVLTFLEIPGLGTGWYLFGGTSAGAPQWAAITAIANQRAGTRLGFLNAAIYRLMATKKTYAESFHDVTVGTNSSLQFDVSGDPVDITGFDAMAGWDATTGAGSPMASNLVDNLIRFRLPGDATAVLANSKPKSNAKPSTTSSVTPH